MNATFVILILAIFTYMFLFVSLLVICLRELLFHRLFLTTIPSRETRTTTTMDNLRKIPD